MAIIRISAGYEEGADYICDGHEDQVEIEAASEAAGKGAVLSFAPGEYRVSSLQPKDCQFWSVTPEVKFTFCQKAITLAKPKVMPHCQRKRGRKRVEQCR